MENKINIKVIQNNAIRQLPAIVNDFSLTKKVLLVADNRTYQVAGELVSRTLASAGFQIEEAVLCRNESLVPDERALGEILVKWEPDNDVLIAVGTGSIIDLTRYTGFKLRKPFIIIPTAPSMDGFASPVAALTIHGFKKTLTATIPAAIVADPQILVRAPEKMILAGLGDLLGKYTALADWKLGQFINQESYSTEIASRVRAMVDQTSKLFVRKNNDPQIVKDLTEALIVSGEAMLQWGNSRPASGAEHHLAHFWEMQAALTAKKSFLHGTKVGIAVILVAAMYHKVFNLELAEVKRLIAQNKPESEEQYISRLKRVFGQLANDILTDLNGLYLDNEQRIARQKMIVENWQTMKQWVQHHVPTSETIRELLIGAGAPVVVDEIEVNAEMLKMAMDNAKEVRRRYTIFRLAEDIGWH